MLPVAAGAGGAVVVLVLMVLTVRRRRRHRRQIQMAANLVAPVSAMDLERMLEAKHLTGVLPPGAAEPLALPPPPAVSKPVRERVAEAVRGDVDRAASVLSAWLQEAAPRSAK